MMSESRTRGHNYKLEKSRCNATLKLKQNAPPQHVVNAKTVNPIKFQLDKFYADGMYGY